MILILVLFPGISVARDFMVQFIEENYKQTYPEYSNSPDIYHSIQVMTDVAGPKLLVLSGDNHLYRTWLRQYIASRKSFMVTIPDNETDRFMGSKVFEMDVTALHPFNTDKWETVPGDENTVFLNQSNTVLIVDANQKRSFLISTVLQHMGYGTSVFSEPNQALKSFQQQPQMYDLIILDYDIPGITIKDFINTVVAIDRQIPIIVGSGYKNTRIHEEFVKNFSTTTSVLVVPVVLNDLKNRIQQLLKQEA